MTAADLDRHFVDSVRALTAEPPRHRSTGFPDDGLLVQYFDAQLQSRHVDFAARVLQQRGQGFYTIASAGHESDAALGLCTRVTDPALLHYRSGAFYAARASLVDGSTPIRDVLAGCAASTLDPISAGRHKVFGNADLAVIPQTSTIASHLPRALGLALALPRMQRLGLPAAWPHDSVVVCSFGDASANHSTAVGALDAAAYCRHRGLPVPLLLVCEDNGIGISVPTPPGWLERSLSSYPGIAYRAVDGSDPVSTLRTTRDAVETVRAERVPLILHLRTVRYLGHAGSDVESTYRSARALADDLLRDPLLGTARELIARGVYTTGDVLERYEQTRRAVAAEADALGSPPRLGSAAEVVRPLSGGHTVEIDAPSPPPASPLTLAQAVTRTLADLLDEDPRICVFGEDVGVKGGVYGLTRGLQQRFGRLRVFDTLLDEQTILGTALGFAVAGMLPIPEIQYLAYLHNAEDQLRGEAASLAFFSDGRYRNPMVVRIAGLPYQRGFGGHFHNDNSVAVLRDIPGLVLAVPTNPARAGALLRTCVALARAHGRVCVYLEPIALYHRRDLYDDGDDLWLGRQDPSVLEPGSVETYGDGRDVLVVTFGNGVPMSLRAARRTPQVAVTVLDLQWLAPLPVAALTERARSFPRVLVVDETRRSGGVAEAVIAALVEDRYAGRIDRVSSSDSFVPLGPTASLVLVSEDDIVEVLSR